MEVAARQCFFDLGVPSLKRLATHLEVPLVGTENTYGVIDALLTKVFADAPLSDEDRFAILLKRVAVHKGSLLCVVVPDEVLKGMPAADAEEAQDARTQTFAFAESRACAMC